MWEVSTRVSEAVACDDMMGAELWALRASRIMGVISNMCRGREVGDSEHSGSSSLSSSQGVAADFEACREPLKAILLELLVGYTRRKDGPGVIRMLGQILSLDPLLVTSEVVKAGLNVIHSLGIPDVAEALGLSPDLYPETGQSEVDETGKTGETGETGGGEESSLGSVRAVLRVWRKSPIEKILEVIRRAGLELDVVAYTQVLRAMAVSKRIADAEYVVQAMEADSVSPNVVSYTTLIRGYTKMSDMEGAESVLTRMKALGVERNDFTYNTLQQGYIRVGDFDASHAMLGRMERDGVIPDAVSYVQLITGYAKRGMVAEAKAVFDTMPMVPTSNAYLALARAYVNAADFDGMDNVLASYLAECAPALSPELESLARSHASRPRKTPQRSRSGSSVGVGGGGGGGGGGNDDGGNDDDGGGNDDDHMQHLQSSIMSSLDL